MLSTPIARSRPSPHVMDHPDMAELYCMGRLPAEQMREIEDHALGCPACADGLQETEQFIHALRNVLRRGQA